MKRSILPALLLAMCWPSAPNAAPVVVVARPAVVARPVTVSRPAPVVRNVPTTNYRGTSTTIVPLYVPLMLSTGTSGERETVDVATPLLTICTEDQFAQAMAWQEDCRALQEIGSGYCPLLSYFRFCKEAAPEDVQGLKPAGKHYRHVFLAH
jgi:hypothetical protein